MTRHFGSALGRVLGRGSARSGSHHWRVQRLSALALIPLTLWLLAGLVCLPDFSHASVLAWLSQGLSPVWMGLTLIALCWHSQLGVQVVIEDYVHQHGLKITALLLSSALHVVIAAAGLVALVRIATAAN